jgi:hypothetical protein
MSVTLPELERILYHRTHSLPYDCENCRQDEGPGVRFSGHLLNRTMFLGVEVRVCNACRKDLQAKALEAARLHAQGKPPVPAACYHTVPPEGRFLPSAGDGLRDTYAVMQSRGGKDIAWAGQRCHDMPPFERLFQVSPRPVYPGPQRGWVRWTHDGITETVRVLTKPWPDPPKPTPEDLREAEVSRARLAYLAAQRLADLQAEEWALQQEEDWEREEAEAAERRQREAEAERAAQHATKAAQRNRRWLEALHFARSAAQAGARLRTAQKARPPTPAEIQRLVESAKVLQEKEALLQQERERRAHEDALAEFALRRDAERLNAEQAALVEQVRRTLRPGEILAADCIPGEHYIRGAGGCATGHWVCLTVGAAAVMFRDPEVRWMTLETRPTAVFHTRAVGGGFLRIPGTVL